MKVSVMIASYNHEKFVAQAIQSVLDQSYQNFEILITDDGSTDRTWNEIKKFSDSRIIAERLPENRGAVFAGRRCFEKVTGDVICVLSSDDCWYPDKLKIQVEQLLARPDLGAVFSTADYIDDDGRPVPKSESDVFTQPNRTREEWFRFFFFNGNAICHPSIMIRKECYEVLGYYDNRLRQLPDAEMWIRFVKHFEFYIEPRSLIKFRLHGGGANTSAPNEINIRRTWNEIFVSFFDFFDGVSEDFFYTAFANDLRRPDLRSSLNAEIEQAFLYLKASDGLGKMYGAIGLKKLFDILGTSDGAQKLAVDYKFSDVDFHQLSGKVRSFHDPVAPVTIASFKSKEVVFEAAARVRSLVRRKILGSYV